MGLTLSTLLGANPPPNENASFPQYQNLPPEVQDLVHQFQNCGQFYQHLQPMTASEIDDKPSLRRALRDVVIDSLSMFLQRVNKLKVYKYAGIKYPNKHQFDDEFNSMPLCYRVYLAVDAVKKDPEMPAAELLERCRRIVDWKRELRQMPAVFARLLQAYQGFLNGQPSYGPLHAAWDETGLELFDVENHSNWGQLGWYEGSLYIPEEWEVEADAQRIVGLADRVSHDNAILDNVLKEL